MSIKEQSDFCHMRTHRAEGIKFAFVSLAILVFSFICLNVLNNIKPEEILIINSVLVLIFLCMWVFLVIPNLLNKGKLEFKVSQKEVTCYFSDGDNYCIPFNDIDHVIKIRKVQIDNYVDYWIVDQKGENFLIPASLGLSPHKVLTSLKNQIPNLDVRKMQAN